MAGLAFNIDPAGRLLIISRRRRCAALRLTATSADVLFPGLAPVSLPWDAYRTAPGTADEPAGDGWAITHFANTYAGLALDVRGRNHPPCRDVIDATGTRWRHAVLSWGTGTNAGHRIAVLPTNAVPRYARECATLAALATVLTARPELRRALSDPARTARLAADLASGLLPEPPKRPGGRPDTVDVLRELRAVGVFHRFGRPLPGDAMPTLAEIVALVHSRLRANADVQQPTVDDRRIAKLARRHYLDVQPWPFAGLLY